MVVKMREGQLVGDHSECWFGTGLMLAQKELNEYVKQGELEEGQASNYCLYRQTEIIG